MKKLALVLASLLMVGTVATAKEVMPKPEVVPEKVVEYVEKPVIVYRDREVAPAWKPNGSVDVRYTWYGETENKNPGEDKDGDWARGRGNYGRLQTLTSVNFTKEQNLEIRTRNFHTLRDTENKRSVASSDHFRLRHHYNFGKLGSTNIKAKSRLEYGQSKGDEGSKTLKASVFFDFADYFPSAGGFKVDKFGLRPGYSYIWSGHGNGEPNQDYNSGTRSKYTLDFESEYSMPLGFSAEFNLYSGYDRHRESFAVGTSGETKKGQFYGSAEAYIYQHTPLYKTDKFEVAFNFDVGYDPYEFNQYKVIKNLEGRRTSRSSYEVYALSHIGVSYKPTEFVKLFANVGAEYRNWAVSAKSEAKNWRWHPTAWAGMKITF